MSPDLSRPGRDVQPGVPTGAVSPSAAPVEHDLPGGAPVLARIYRPDRTQPGAFGPGFRSLFDLALVAVDGHVVVESPDHRRLRFVPTSHGWMCTAGPHHSLSVADRTWRLTIGTGRGSATAEFDVHGLLTAWASEAVDVHLTRDVRRRPIAVDVVHGGLQRRLHLAWVDGTVVQATTDRGLTATYEYGTTGSSAGRLVRVRRPDGVVSYAWHDGAAQRRHLAAVS